MCYLSEQLVRNDRCAKFARRSTNPLVFVRERVKFTLLVHGRVYTHDGYTGLRLAPRCRLRLGVGPGVAVRRRGPRALSTLRSSARGVAWLPLPRARQSPREHTESVTYFILPFCSPKVALTFTYPSPMRRVPADRRWCACELRVSPFFVSCTWLVAHVEHSHH